MTTFLVGDRVEYSGPGQWSGLQGTVRDVGNGGRMVIVKAEPDGIVLGIWNRNLTRIPRPIHDRPMTIDSNEVHGPDRIPEPTLAFARDGSLGTYLVANLALDAHQIEGVVKAVGEWFSSMTE